LLSARRIKITINKIGTANVIKAIGLENALMLHGLNYHGYGMDLLWGSLDPVDSLPGDMAKD
jgi:hypothetical protein